MVYLGNVNGQSLQSLPRVAFGKENLTENEQLQKKPAKLLYEESKNSPISTKLKVQGNKLKNAFTTYPEKGFQGSKNSNFYEFLTMGTVPYIVGSGMMIAVFNAATAFFDSASAASANKLGKKMALGVLFYGIASNLSKKFIETPLNLKYGIDVNLPYKKKINELPEERNVHMSEKKKHIGNNNPGENNKDNLVAYEYHESYESVDFPYWDLYYDNKSFGEDRDAYFKKVGKKMGFKDEELDYSDQTVKPLIKEKLVQTKAFSSLSSFLWGAVGVGIASQKPFEELLISPVKRFNDWKKGIKHPFFLMDFGKKFLQSCKDFVGMDKMNTISYIVKKCKYQSMNVHKIPKPVHFAGRALLGTAIGTTLLGNFLTLTDFNKDRGSKNPSALTSLINENKEKVVC